MTPKSPTLTQLKRENKDLRAQLVEAQETLEALRNGTSQFLMLSGTSDDPVYNVPEAEHLYRLLIEQMSEGAATLSAEGVILYANQRLADMFGAPLERVTGTSLLGWLTPAEQKQVQSMLQKTDGRVNRVEVALRRGNESLLPASLSVVRLEGGTLPVISLIATDLSEQKLREARLRESEALFHQMFDNHDAIMLLIEPNSGVIVDANLAAEKFYGYSREQLKWMKIDQINVLPPEEVKRRRLEAAHEGLNSFVFPHRLASGEVRMVEVHSSPIQVNQSLILFSVIHDVTARQQAEEKLRTSEETNRVIFNAVTESLFLIEPSGKILTANPTTSSRLGMQGADLIGANIFDLLPAEIARSRKEWITKVMKERQAVHFEDFRRNAWIDNNIYPILDEDGQVRQLAIFGRDITERRLAENTLRASEEKFSRVFEDSSALIAIAEEVTGNYVDVNDAWLRTMEYSREEVIGHPPSLLGTFPDIDQYHQAWLDLRAQGVLHEHEITLRTKTGKIVYGVFSANWIELQGKRYLLTVTNDITARKQAEEALRESEVKFAAAFHTSPVAMVISRLSDGMFLEFNDEMERVSGYSRAELEGQSAVGLGMYANPAIRQSLAAQGDFLKFEIQMRHKSGQWRWLDLNVSPIKIQGQDCRLTVIQDIHDRKLMEQALRESESRFSTIFRSSPVGIVLFHLPDFKIVDVNQAWTKTTGATLEESVGRASNEIFEWIPPEERQTLINTLLEEGRIQNQEVRMRHPSGEFSYLSLSAEIMTLGDEKFALVMSLDITEQKNAQAEAESVARFPAENPNPVLRFDRDGRILYANKASDLLLRDWNCTVGDRAPAFWQEQVADSFSQQSNKVIEVSSGGLVYLTTIHCVAHAEYVNLYLSDITQMKEAEQQRQTALNELALERALLRQLIDNLPDLIFLKDRESRFLVANQTTAEFMGADSPEQLLGRTDFDFYPEPLAQQYRSAEQQVMESGESILGFERPQSDLHENDHWLSATKMPLRDAQGQIIGLVGIERDITTRKMAELELQASEEKYRGLMDSQDTAVGIIDGECRFQYMNAKMAQSIGGTAEESIGKTLSDIFPEHIASRQKELTYQVFREDKSLNFEEMLILQGEPRWHHTCIQPLHDEAGRVISVLINATDVHELKMAQQELQELNHKLEERVKERTAQVQDLYDNAPVGYHSLDKDGRIVTINQTELIWLGYTREEMLGKHATELFSEKEKQVFEEAFPRFKATGFISDLVLEAVRKDGTVFPVSVSSTAIYDADGNYLSSRTTLTDVTERKRAEQTLRQSEEKYSTLFHKSAVPSILSTYPDSVYVDVNEIFTKQYGYTREEMLGKTSIEVGLVRPAERAHMFEKFKERGLLSGNQIPVFTKEGEERIVLLNSQKIEFDGRAYLITTAYDITEQMLAVMSLRESEQKYTALFNKSAVPAILTKHPEGIYVDVNEAFTKKYGYSREEMLGKISLDIGLIRPNDRLYMLKTFEENGRYTGNELNVFTKAGEERIVLLSANEFELGGQLYAISTAYDITEQKRAETALRENEERMELAFRAAQDGIWDWNMETDEVFYSSRWKSMLGYEDAEIEHHVSAWRRLLHPDDLPRALQVVEEVMHGDKEYFMEFRMRHKDGHYVDILSRGTPIRREPGGPIVRIVGTHVDLTDRKTAEEALRSVNTELEVAMRVKDEFLASMSHELRTPLTGILGVSEMLLGELFGTLNERQKRYVQIVDTSGRHLLSLINDILDLSKVQSGKLEARFEVVSVTEICHMSMLFINQSAVNKQVSLALICEYESLPLVADPLRLKQILVNLLSNAVKFAPENSEVTLRVDVNQEAQTIVFSVTDTGIGIRAEDVSKLFQPFTQLDSSLARKFEGTGLGLALVKKMVELHNGTVTVKSEVGQGSTFIVTLPWRQTLDYGQPSIKTQLIEPAPSQDVATGERTQGLILLAEDNDVNSKVIKDFLESVGYDVILARHGGEVLPMIEKHHPDVILMDIQMPVMDGLEATRLVRSKPEYQRLPIVAITALAMPGDEERCFEAGVNEYFSKPYSLNTLTIAIGKLLGQRK